MGQVRITGTRKPGRTAKLNTNAAIAVLEPSADERRPPGDDGAYVP